MFGFGLYDVLIIAGILGLQYFLSTRNHVIWGALVPIVYVTYLSWNFFANGMQSLAAFILLLIVGMLFLIEQWHRGRKSLQTCRKKEVDKMILKDIT